MVEQAEPGTIRPIHRIGTRLKGWLMRILIAALAIAVTMASAQAQVAGVGGPIPGSQIGKHVSDQHTEGPKVKVDDKAYNSALRNLPDKQYDPWHGVR